MTYPEWWPDGCDESLVRDCNCQTCEAMIQELEEFRREKSQDGEHAPLDVFE